MPCSYCQGFGHNRRTCPELNELLGHLPINPVINPEPVLDPEEDDFFAILNLGNAEDMDWVDPVIEPVPVVPVPIVEPVPEPKLKQVTLYNMKSENYILYWVIGDWTIYDLDENENQIQYIGLLHAKSQLIVNMKVGHRFHLVPHLSPNLLVTEPMFHPPTDQKFWTKPYATINFSNQQLNEIYIDDKDNLSELNQWKFTAIKLDYLMKELIKLGGMNVDTLAPILDLHQDITLLEHGEFDKDRAGIPSAFTNIT